MGSYIGSALSRLATGYLDEKKNQDALERQRRLDAQNEQEKQAIARDRQTQLQRLQEQMDYTQQRTTMRDNEQDADRKAFPEMFQKARAGDESALGWVLNRYPQMATALTKPEPQERSLTWRNDVRGDDGKAYQVGVDASGKEVKRLPQFVKPNENDALGWARLDLERKRLEQAGDKVANAFAKPPSSGVQQEYLTHLTLKKQAERALAELDANPDAVGFWKGVGMGIVGEPTNRFGKAENIATRGKIGDIGSLKIKERSGAAVTASESPRLKPFIPSTMDNYNTARTKLLGLIEQADLTLNTADEEYGGFFSARSGTKKTSKESGASLVSKNRR